MGTIGIVAAMTVPALVSKYQRKVLQEQFKKSYAVAAQVILRAKSELGSVAMAQYCTNYNGTDYINNNACLQAFYDVMFPNKPKVSYDIARSDVSSFTNKHHELSTRELGGMSYPIFFVNVMADGTYMNVNINEHKVNFGIDINGAKGPNKLGWDVFLFQLNPDDDSLSGIAQTREYTDEEIENIDFVDSINPNRYGYPCNLNTNMKGNGIGCSAFALKNICPWDAKKTYWECLP